MQKTFKIIGVPLEEIARYTAVENSTEMVPEIYNPLQKSKQMVSQNLLSFAKEATCEAYSGQIYPKTVKKLYYQIPSYEPPRAHHRILRIPFIEFHKSCNNEQILSHLSEFGNLRRRILWYAEFIGETRLIKRDLNKISKNDPNLADNVLAYCWFILSPSQEYIATTSIYAFIYLSVLFSPHTICRYWFTWIVFDAFVSEYFIRIVSSCVRFRFYHLFLSNL